ncbi:MAG TPA: hypothetical protein VMO00_03665, partial [Methylomirabilota bacterium]|nr:hypothetical protein [Methylomirabilota bacterium]
TVNGDLMKIDISFLAAVLVIGTDLLARAAVQGVEQALVASAIEYASAGVLHLSKWSSDQGAVLSSVKRIESQIQRRDGSWNP